MHFGIQGSKLAPAIERSCTLNPFCKMQFTQKSSGVATRMVTGAKTLSNWMLWASTSADISENLLLELI
jgi:hypothetical protein